jgi:hypothetical protein
MGTVAVELDVKVRIPVYRGRRRWGTPVTI